MERIKIIQVETPMFEFEGEKYYIDDYRYLNFGQFQDDIDKAIKRGATHCFICSVKNTYPDGKYISEDPEGKLCDIWIRHKFLNLNKEKG